MPGGEDLAWQAASRYVAGTTVTDALRTTRELHQQGVASSIDQFGELVGDPAVAQRGADDYRRLAVELVALPFGRDWFRYWMRRLAESRRT